MMIEKSLWPAIIVFIPFLTGSLVFLTSKSSLKLKEWLALLGSLLPFIFLLLIIPLSLRNVFLVTPIIRITPDIWLRFRADQLALIFGSTAALLWSMASLYSWGYMKGKEHLTRFYGFLLLNLSWTLGVALAGNLLTLYIFYELLSISSYPIIAHEETPEALAAAKKYLIYVIVGGVFIFLGLVMTYFLCGTQAFTETGIMSLSIGKTMLTFIFLVFITGFGVKAALMPLHGWVPDAHPAAPAPASALLSGILVAAGAFGIIRIFYNIFGASLVQKLQLNLPLAYLASLTIIVSSILAITQDNLKRRLAYSTIGQMSYVVLGISLITPNGFLGGVVHIANHAFMKGTLFLTAGVLIKAAGKRNVSEMNGVGYAYPLTMGAFTIAALALIGTPPMAGFVSKWLLGVGTLEASQPIFLAVLLLGSLLCAGYLLPVVYVSFFKKETEEILSKPAAAQNKSIEKSHPEVDKVPWSMLTPIFIGILAVIILGICAALYGLPISLAETAAKKLLSF
jgi:multicomponent Na+:H+ antiporter subunit D